MLRKVSGAESRTQRQLTASADCDLPPHLKKLPDSRPVAKLPKRCILSTMSSSSDEIDEALQAELQRRIDEYEASREEELVYVPSRNMIGLCGCVECYCRRRKILSFPPMTSR